MIAATDYLRLHSEQIRGYVPRRYHAGTDGWGPQRWSREAAPNFFEVHRNHVYVVAALGAGRDGDRHWRRRQGHREIRHRRRASGAATTLGGEARQPRRWTGREGSRGR
ncbi:MAG: hypothetical protein R3E53_12780 [Myxococcota bacterium]